MTLREFLAEWDNPADHLVVKTSGSTGTPKPITVLKQRMVASATMTCDFLNLQEGDTALLCMPLDYIAGKMVVVRSLVRRLKLIDVGPTGHPLEQLTEAPTFVAMTPLQLFNTLQVRRESELLMQVRQLIIGGGAIDPNIAATLRHFPNAVWSTYGMTETLSHIALRRLSGSEATEWYTPLPSVRVALTADSCLIVDAPALTDNRLTTNDIATLRHENGHQTFRILGRKDNTICSGGIKIQAEEVERLLATHLSTPFMITKTADPKFGEAVVLVVEGGDTHEAEAICRRHLPRYWVPKHYKSVPCLPRTETGKVKRT